MSREPRLIIEPADLEHLEVQRFLRAHFTDIAPTAPAASQHALDLDAMRTRPGFRLWVGRMGGAVVGTVGLATVIPHHEEFSPEELSHEELKSMRTTPEARGRGIGGALVEFALADARRRGIRRISLETGSMDFFAAARSLYRRFGFADCPAFGDYPSDDPNSVFMTRLLAD